MGGGGTIAPGGVDQAFVVNHLAPFLLTHLLLDALKSSAPARIVNVASMMHRFARLEPDDVPVEGPYNALRGYNRSKLALILFTRVLARRLEGTRVVINALHPGAVRPGGQGRGGSALLQALLWFMLTPEEGARTSLYLAAAPEAAEMSGSYFVKCPPAPVAPRATNDMLAERVWTASARLTGLPV
jgi:retinol dehydrogenase 12